MSHRNRSAVQILRIAVSLVLVLVLWTCLRHLSSAAATYFPPPGQVIERLLTSHRQLLASLGLTLWRAFAGFALALAGALPAAFAMAKVRWLDDIVSPVVDFLRPLPSTAIIPAAIAVLGIDERMKVAVVLFGSVWPLLLNSYHGFNSLDPVLVDVGKTMDLTRWQMFSKIALPYALPFIFTGIRISISICLILAVTVEMIAGSSGLGFLIMDFERSFRYAEMYASILFLALAGLMVNKLMDLIGRYFVFWT